MMTRIESVMIPGFWRFSWVYKSCHFHDVIVIFAMLQVMLLSLLFWGKSSVINTLKRKTVCKAAPVPGETRVWQYIALTRTATRTAYDSTTSSTLSSQLRNRDRIAQISIQSLHSRGAHGTLFWNVYGKHRRDNFSITEWFRGFIVSCTSKVVLGVDRSW